MRSPLRPLPRWVREFAGLVVVGAGTVASLLTHSVRAFAVAALLAVALCGWTDGAREDAS